jgi:hypothetical protein
MTFAKLNRTNLQTTMPLNIKKAFIILVQKHPALKQTDKDFICDNLFHYESISQASRMEVLDIIDSMELFVFKG